ncbi:hypothetical protein F5Y04DRAFT_285570 [Hypomontagnella monticulosa]|nr:hypothetical protein F5Y04DRAFT_285570 [Hypomontagnella monticulosa]
MAPISKSEITEKEAQVLATAWQCFRTQPEIDLPKLAKLTGYTNPRSVQNVLSAVKKKISAGLPADDEGPTTPVKNTPKAKATPRKRKNIGGSDDDSSDVASPTPAKRSRRKLKISEPIVKDEDEDENQGENDLKEHADAPVKEEAADGDDDVVE